MILIDTNIIIYYLKGHEVISDWLEMKISKGATLAISTLSVVELLGFKNITSTEQTAIQRLLQTIMVVDVDMIIAHEAARIRQQHHIGTVDAVIAATAKILAAELITNDKNLRKVLGIRVSSLAGSCS